MIKMRTKKQEIVFNMQKDIKYKCSILNENRDRVEIQQYMYMFTRRIV